MRSYVLAVPLFILLVFAEAAEGQPTRKSAASGDSMTGGSVATAAFAEVALRRAEFEADLEALLVDYTDDFPKVKELRFGLTRIGAEIERLKAVKPADRDRATSALGKLMVRKVEAEVELWKLEQSYADSHPEVRRARKRVEIFEKAIKEILG